MNERIRKFMESQGLSPSELADTIGVQRSNVTHVLNGRNNPSFPFIEKLLKKYPKLNAKWLLLGEGTMLEGKPVFPASLFDATSENNINKTTIVRGKKQELNEENPAVYTSAENKIKTVTSPEQEQKIIKSGIPELTGISSEDKTIEKVMVFYSNQTFQVYRPLK